MSARRDGLYDEDGVDGPFERAMQRAMDDDAEAMASERRRAAKPCGDCEDYAGYTQKCGTCASFVCWSCKEPIVGEPYFTMGNREHLPQDLRSPYCDDECAADAAEKAHERQFGERR